MVHRFDSAPIDATPTDDGEEAEAEKAGTILYLLLSGSCGISGLAVCLLFSVAGQNLLPTSSSHCPRRRDDTMPMAVPTSKNPPCSEELGISAFLHCRASTERVNTQSLAGDDEY